MSQAQYREAAKALAVVKGQLNACKTRFAQIADKAGDLPLGSERHTGTEKDLIGVQCYALCISVESLFRHVDSLTALIRQKADLPVLKENDRNYYFQKDMLREMNKIKEAIKGMSQDEAMDYVKSLEYMQ